MRLIGTLDNERQAMLFSLFLQRRGIIHQIEVQTNTDWGSSNYGAMQCKIWINEEDQVNEALKWYHLFLHNPQDPTFSPPPGISPLALVDETSEPIATTPLNIRSQAAKNQHNSAKTWDKQPMGWITRLLILTCSLLLLFSELFTPKTTLPGSQKQLTLYASPIEKALLYDYPYRYELIDQFIQLYGNEDTKQSLPPEATALLNKISHTPFWQGIYPLLLGKTNETFPQEVSSTPMFEKIQEGQVWRLFTPDLLHADIFHLFFNMLWLIVLGKQIEQRLSMGRYILFVLVLGIFSNTLQYLISGPNFIGFSGILCGMLTFIWERQKHAPWEGYQLNRLTYLFMIVFIVGMACIQLLSFFAEKSFHIHFAPNIANTAHLSGALMGYLLGKITTFSWRHS